MQIKNNTCPIILWDMIMIMDYALINTALNLGCNQLLSLSTLLIIKYGLIFKMLKKKGDF